MSQALVTSSHRSAPRVPAVRAGGAAGGLSLLSRGLPVRLAIAGGGAAAVWMALALALL